MCFSDSCLATRLGNLLASGTAQVPWQKMASIQQATYLECQLMPVNTLLAMRIALCRGMNIFLFYINYHKMVALGVFLAHGAPWHLEHLSSYISEI